MNLQFYTLKEAAKILKCTVRTVQRHAHRIGKKKGAILRFTDSDIKKMAGVS